jgi:hypothetical protein
MRGRAETDPRLPFTGCLASTEETSREAAEYAATNAETLRWRVFQVIHRAGKDGATDLEIQAELGLDGSTQRPRRIELLQAGDIEDSGQTRETPSGRRAVVWIAVEDRR